MCGLEKLAVVLEVMVGELRLLDCPKRSVCRKLCSSVIKIFGGCGALGFRIEVLRRSASSMLFVIWCSRG